MLGASSQDDLAPPLPPAPPPLRALVASAPAPPSPLTGPLLVWLAVQFLALTASAFRVPLAAGFGTTGEHFAAHGVVATQVIASAMLFPFLLRTGPATVAVILSTWPFVVMGGALSALPWASVALAGAYVTAWIASLRAWKAVTPARLAFPTVAAATLLTAGALPLLYLRLDFSPGGPVDAADIARQWAPVSPLLAAVGMLNDGFHARDWSVPVVLAGAALIGLGLTSRRRQVIHRF